MSKLTSITTAAPTTLRGSSPVVGAWRDLHDLAGVAVTHTDAVPAQPSIHNSMTPMGAAPVNSFDAGRRVYAAKQAAPPRGRYR